MAQAGREAAVEPGFRTRWATSMQNLLSSSPLHNSTAASAGVDSFAGDSRRLLFSSSDRWEVQSLVAGVMRSHKLSVVGERERLDARMHYAALGDVALSRLSYGASVQIDPDPLEAFFLVQMPLAGGARISSARANIQSDAQLASVLNPDDEVHMHWLAGNDQLMLRISRSLVERTLVAQLGRELHQPLNFELGFRWRDSGPWMGLLSYLGSCTAQASELLQHKLVVAHIEQLAAAMLLTAHRHNYSETTVMRCSQVLPRHIRKVQEYLQANAHEPVTAEQLAQIAGVSVRSLYTGFKDFLGASPMQYLRDLRMERARAELMTSDVSNVAAVALRWGFAHLGRFSSEYRQRYGEAPSQTLKSR